MRKSFAAFGCGADLKMAAVKGQMGSGSDCGKGDGLHQAQIFLVHADAGDGIEGDEVFARRDAAHHAEMALDEIRLVGHVAVHVGPAIFLDDAVEIVERGVVIGGIAGDDFALEARVEEVEGRARHVFGLHQVGVVGVSVGVDLDGDEGSGRVFESWRRFCRSLAA